MRNIEPDHVPKTMDMFLILLESYTLYGQHSSRNSAIRVGIVLEAQIWGLDLRYNRSSAFMLVCIKLETYLTKRAGRVKEKSVKHSAENLLQSTLYKRQRV